KGEEPITVRPGSIMEDIDLAATKTEVEATVGRDISDQELASYLMYPQVFTDYAAHLEKFGDVSKIPTAAYFYGMEAGEEVAIEMERGKALIVRFLALGDADDDGTRTVFFELNGQPRSVRIDDHAQESKRPTARAAEADNANHVSAPMPGIVSSLVVEVGQKVLQGDTLLSIEAMKMETAVNAEQDGTIAEVVATIGLQIAAKDLLIVFED
ncbi:MAG: biotin/lipoyl-containing protein, partial [Rhodospirillales bacterium]